MRLLAFLLLAACAGLTGCATTEGTTRAVDLQPVVIAATQTGQSLHKAQAAVKAIKRTGAKPDDARWSQVEAAHAAAAAHNAEVLAQAKHAQEAGEAEAKRANDRFAAEKARADRAEAQGRLTGLFELAWVVLSFAVCWAAPLLLRIGAFSNGIGAVAKLLPLGTWLQDTASRIAALIAVLTLYGLYREFAGPLLWLLQHLGLKLGG